jgi:aspartate aminotransferase
MDKHILADRVIDMKESETLAMTRKSRELKDKGIDVITLSIGEPDFNTPDLIKEAGKRSIDNNITHYPPVPGLQQLREGISKKLKRDNGLEYKPSQIVVSNGAKQSIANILFSIMNAGDEIIIPKPYWVSYPSMVDLTGGKSVYIDTSIEQDFKVTPEQIEKAITSKTKAFLFNSPSNPTGSVYSIKELEAIAKLFEKYPDILIISDEIYELIIFDGVHKSLAEFPAIKEQVVVVNGVSKGFAMTGWRIGYIAAPQLIADACTKLQGQYTSGAGTISQMAALEAVNTVPSQSDELKSMNKAFMERRDLLIDLLKEIPGMKTNVPQGAFYLFPDISYYLGKSNGDITVRTSSDLCMYLLDNAHTAIVPGEAFGAPDCIRISYATSKEEIKEAVKRLNTALEKLN